MCDYDSYWDLTKVWQVTRCDKHRVRRNSLGGTPILREVIDCIYVYYVYLTMFHLLLWICLFLFLSNMFKFEMTSKPVWGVLRGNDDMTWFGQNECRCWLGSLNVAATATHEICEVCHWIGLRPFLYDPHLYGVHSTPTWVVILWCINEVSQVRLVLGWFSIIGSSAPVPCPQSITALLFCSFFHKGSPYHPYISWHPWSEGLAFDESQLGVSFEKEPLRVMHYGCNRFQPGQWHASGLIPRHGVYGAWSEGPEQSLNFQVSFVEKYAIFPITDEPIREAVFFPEGGGRDSEYYVYIYTYIHICWQEKSSWQCTWSLWSIMVL